MLGISFDNAAANRAFAEKFDYTFPLLCDTSRTVGMAYGACKDVKDRYAARLTYVIGPDGSIEQSIETKDPAGQAQALLATMPKKGKAPG